METPVQRRDRRPLVRRLVKLGSLMMLLGLWFWALDASIVGVVALIAIGLVMVGTAIRLSRGLEPQDQDLQGRRWPPFWF